MRFQQGVMLEEQVFHTNSSPQNILWINKMQVDTLLKERDEIKIGL